MQRRSPSKRAPKVKGLSLKRLEGPGGWLTGLTLTITLLFWNWRLVFATGSGVMVMLGVYLLQDRSWQQRYSELRRNWNSSNQRFTLSVASGGLAVLTTYIAIAIWTDTESHWLASGLILQGLGTLSVLAILIGQTLNRQAMQQDSKLSQLIQDLTHEDALKRLISVRQLTQWIERGTLDPAEHPAISDCFRLLLSRETEPVVRDAVLDGLQSLETTHRLAPGAGESLMNSAAARKAAVRVQRRQQSLELTE